MSERPRSALDALSRRSVPASRKVLRHYFHQDLLLANRIFKARPRNHVDVGSRVDGFVAHVASFRPIEVLDLRPSPFEIKIVTFAVADLMNLPEKYGGTVICCPACTPWNI